MKHYLLLLSAGLLFSTGAFAQTVNCNTVFLESDWNCLGPFEYPADNQMGRVISLWVDPENTEHILAGTRASSLWETHDGGEHWQNVLSYDFPAIGVWDIVNFDEGSENATYLSTMYWASDMNIYNLGLMYFDTNTDIWVEVDEFPVYGPSYDDKYDFLTDMKLDLAGSRKLSIRPGTSELWAVNGQNVFKWDMSIKDWTWDLPALNLHDAGVASDLNHTLNGVAFAPWNNKHAIITPRMGSEGDVLFTDEANEADPAWTALATPYTGLFTLADGDTYEMTCAVSIPVEHKAYVFANYVVLNDDYDIIGRYSRLYEYALPITGAYDDPYLIQYYNFPHLSDLPGSAWGGFDNLIVLPDNPDVFIIADPIGSLFTGNIPVGTSDIDIVYVSCENPGTASNTHSDIRDVQYIYDAITHKGSVYIATDGGLSLCADITTLLDDNENDAAWQNLNGYGLTITEFLGFNNSEMEEYLTMGLSPDGNNYILGNLNTDAEAFFTNFKAADGYDGAISYEHQPKSIYTQNSQGTRDPSDFRQLNLETAVISASLPTVPKSKQSACTDCDICPDNCRQHNFSLKPFSFENHADGEYFWTGTSDMFRDKDPFSNAVYVWEPMSKTYITLVDAIDDDPANPFVLTFDPITAYKQFLSNPATGEITMYYAIKEVRVQNFDEEEVAEDEIKLVKGTWEDNPNPAEDDFYNAEDITPELNESGSGYYNQIDHSIITDMVIDESNPDELWVSFGFNTYGDDILKYILGEGHDAKKRTRILLS